MSGNARPWLVPGYELTSGPVCEKCAQVGQVHDHHETRCQGHTANRLGTGKNPPGWQCTRNRTRGLVVCNAHGGAAPQNRAAGARNVERRAAEHDLAELGYPIETTPVEALEGLLFEAAGNVAFLRALAAGLGIDVHGPTFHATGMATGEGKPHVVVVMYNDERDRLHRIAKDCAALGLDERRVRLAEAQVSKLFDAVTSALQVLPEVHREAFRAALVNALRLGSAHPTS